MAVAMTASPPRRGLVPMDRPMAAVVQMLAAVVSPRMVIPSRTIAPAPRNPMPTTILAATREGSAGRGMLPLRPNSQEASAISVEPTQTSTCVRSPAARPRHSRLSPIKPPSTTASSSASVCPKSDAGSIGMPKNRSIARPSARQLQSRLLLGNEVGDVLCCLLDRHRLPPRLLAPQADLHLAFGQPFAYDHLHRHADQVHVLELDADALLAVVQQRLDMPHLERAIELVRGAALLRIAGIGDQNGDLKRRDADGPEDAVLIVVDLDGGGHRAADAQPVAAHEDGLFLAGLVLVERAHILAVLGAQLEDVPDLDAARLPQMAVAARAPIPGYGRADVAPLRHRKIVAGRDVDAMRVGLVGPDDVVGAVLKLVVGIDGNVLRQPDRSGKAHGRA